MYTNMLLLSKNFSSRSIQHFNALNYILLLNIVMKCKQLSLSIFLEYDYSKDI